MATEDSLDIFGADPFGRDTMYGLSTGRDSQGLAPYGFRYAESVSQPVTAKGRGYLGNVGTMQEPMTELSASSDFGGRTVQYPLVVPTLTAEELNLLRSGGEPTQEIYGKAQQYALGRLARGEDPFATPQDLRYPQPQTVDTRPYDRMQATPRSFISGLFSDVLGRTLNMPSMPRTGIPSIDLLYANKNPLFNLMGVGDVQKTAERISYGEPLTTGSGMTTKPREETLFAGIAVAPLVGEAVNLGARGARAGARMVGQGIAENVAMGRSNLPSLLAEPKSSLFAVEPSALMPKPQAPVSELGFYSAAEQAAMNLQRNKGTGQSFLNDLMKAPDVKKDELSWIGLDDFLKDKPNVTKQEVQDFIASNKIDLQEVRLGEPPPYDKIRLATLENELSQLKEHPIDAPSFGEEKFNELLKLQNIRDQSTVDSLYNSAEIAIKNAQKAQAAGNKELANKYFLESEMFNTRAEALDLQGLGIPNPTKYSNYQLAGGENYREILLKLPEQNITERTWKVLKADGTPTTGFFTSEEAALKDASYINGTVVEAPPVNYVTGYKSSHWGGDLNVLAHMRVNDRIDADGKKMLLVEEIQSDWHQAGREKGYKSQTRSTSEIQKDLDSVLAELRSKPNVSYAPSEDDWARYPEITNRYDSLAAEFDAAKQNKGVPDAPFKDTWYQLALKRILKYAADNGYERVGLTTGTQQAKRYDLSKQVDYIDYKTSGYGDNTKYSLGIVDKNQQGIDLPKEYYSAKELPEIVGKEIAEKIIKGEGQSGGGRMTLRGVDLQVGGEGMKKYYDEVYPKFLEKYGKKWDAKVGETKIVTEASPKSWAYFRDWFAKNHSDVGGSSTALSNWEKGEDSKYVRDFLKQNKVQEPIRYIDITPKMKESIKKGQPLASAEQAPEMLASGGLNYADPFRNPLLESTIG